MTVIARLTGATPNELHNWNTINWRSVNAHVKRLQMRIAKAVREKKMNKVKALQWILAHSFSAKLLAVKKVTSNKGSKTPGIDNIIWNTQARKIHGVLSLSFKGYKALPLRRVEIPKRNGTVRPLGIPTIKDRAMQALLLLALEPIAETLADKNSYGFRPYRACRDAIGQCFCALAKSYSPQWVLEGDITACFDRINHDWLLNNIPLPKRILSQWLSCGFVHNRKLFPTKAGTPQGGIISPILANMTLDGLESVIRKSCPRRRKVNFIRYADDFIVTADCKELIQENIIPAINQFLKHRGLQLSPKKTSIVRIDHGFDFLSQHFRKFRNKLIITPSKESVKGFLQKVRGTINASRMGSPAKLITILNPILRGWCQYHKYVQASRAFSYVSGVIFKTLWRWARKSHSEKSRCWIINKYFNHPTHSWVFCCKNKSRNNKTMFMELLKPSFTKLLRYIKIKAEAQPFDPLYTGYFAMRAASCNACPI